MYMMRVCNFSSVILKYIFYKMLEFSFSSQLNNKVYGHKTKEKEITIAYTYAYRWKHWICTHHTIASSLFVIKWFKRWYFNLIVEKIKILQEKKIAQRRKVFLFFYRYYFMCSRLVMEIQQKTFILERKVYDVLVHCIWCVNNQFVSPFTREIFTNFENFTFFFAKVLYFGKISKSLIRNFMQ